MPQAVISPAAPDDIPALDRLINSAYRGDSSRKGWTTEADLLDGTRTDEASLLEMIGKPAATILKYEEGDELLGCVFLEKKEASLYLGMLTVSPDAQARGIGRQLLAAAEQLAAEQQCRTVSMTVIDVRRELIDWYGRRGYRPTGETRPFPIEAGSGPSPLGIPRQPLRFVVLEKPVG